MTFVHFFHVLMICIHLEDSSNVYIDAFWLDRAKKELQTLKDQYGSTSRQLDGLDNFRFEKDPVTDDPTYRNHTLQIKSTQLNNCYMTETIKTFDDDKDHPIITLHCANEKYKFNLIKNNGHGPYVLSYYSAVDPNGQKENAQAIFRTFAYEGISPLLDAVENRGDKTLKALKWDEAKRVLYAHYIAESTDIETWMEPDNNWRVIDIIRKNKLITSVTHYTYGFVIDGLPFPAQIQGKYTPAADSPFASKTPFNSIIIINICKTDKTPESFRLSAFGLPEPGDSKVKGRRSKSIWGSLIIGSILMGFFFRYLARRRRKQKL